MQKVVFSILSIVVVTQFLTIPVVASVAPGPGFQKMSVLKNDKIFIPLDEVFDLSRLTYPLDSEVEKGQVLTYDKPFASKNFAKFNFKTLNYVKTLSPHMVAFVYDQSKIVI
jgi:hypothetical protein